ncbi:MAG: hypothetical protein IOD12_09920 [Silvanigrellales bacterium]|nr:hypothetical protein [Silvanigrellales bacterium]
MGKTFLVALLTGASVAMGVLAFIVVPPVTRSEIDSAAHIEKLPDKGEAIDESILHAVCTTAPVRAEDGGWTCAVAHACEGVPSAQASFEQAYAGSFSGPGREELFVDLRLDCATHTEDWGGFAFLRREQGAWKKVLLEAGGRPGKCRPWGDEASGRTTLVCEWSTTLQGHTTTHLNHVTLAGESAPESQLIVEAIDDESASECHAYADTITWRFEGPKLHVTFSESRASSELVELAERSECATPFPRQEKLYTFTFVRHGSGFAVTPENHAAYKAYEALHGADVMQ